MKTIGHAVSVALCLVAAPMRGDVLFSQVPPRFDLAAAVYSNLGDIDPPQQIADDFIVDQAGVITNASWWGIYYPTNLETNLTRVEFTLRFFADASRSPGALLGESKVSAAFDPVTVFLDGTVLYKFSGTLNPPMEAASGTIYWVSILDSDSATKTGFRWSEADLFREIARAYRRSETTPWFVQNSWPQAFILEGARLGGTVVAWGGEYGAGTALPGFTNVVAIAAGPGGSLGLKTDGTVVGAGARDITSRQPANLSNVVSVAVGFYFASALKSDGSVTGWGVAQYGETNVPPDLTNAIALSVGNMHSLALKADGTVTSWGWNGYGQTAVPPGLSNVVAVSAGGYQSLALRADGSVVAWGELNNVPPGLGPVRAISAGWGHNLALLENGNLAAWGNNSQGQTVVPSGLPGVRAIDVGGQQNLVLTSDGTVIAWGDNRNGQANVPVGLRNVSAVAGGYSHSIALMLDNDLPVALDQVTSGEEDSDLIVTLDGTNPGAGRLAANILRLPGRGILYQYLAGKRGERIVSVPALVTHPERRVVYAPRENESGTPFDSFDFTVNDGERVSAAATVTINIRAVNDPPSAVASLSSTTLLSSNRNEYVILAPDDRVASVTLDGSLSSDAEGDALQYGWSEAGRTRPFGVTAIVIKSFRPGLYTLELRVSDGAASDFTTIRLRVVTRVQAIGELVTMVTQSNLRENDKRSLTKLLQLTSASMDRHGTRQASIHLRTFRSKVRAQISRTYPEFADRLLYNTDVLISAMEAESNGGARRGPVFRR